MPYPLSFSLLLPFSFSFFISIAAQSYLTYPNCPSYNCNGLNISYPFWKIDNQPRYCGYRGFGINCSTINGTDRRFIDFRGTSYHVDRIFYESPGPSITLVDNDLSPIRSCPRVPHNIDLQTLPFDFSSLNVNLSFHFNCTRIPNFATPIPCLEMDTRKSCVNLLSFEPEDFDWGSYSCSEEVVKTVLNANLPYDRLGTEFGAVLSKGFELNCRSVEGCGKCEESNGWCGLDNNTMEFMCFCSDGRTTTDNCETKKDPHKKNEEMEVNRNEEDTAVEIVDDGEQELNHPNEVFGEENYEHQNEHFNPESHQQAVNQQGINELERLTWKVKLGIGVGVSLLSMVVIFIIYCIVKSSLSNFIAKFKLKTEDDKCVEEFVVQYGSLSTKRYKYVDIKKMTNSFQVKLGQGGFGIVFKGKLSDGRLVAVKVLNSSKAKGQEFINEVASIGRTSHVNIVTLMGFCFDRNKRALVYEFMPNGSLDKFICQNVPLNIREHIGIGKLYEIAHGIARGLDYLHRGCDTRILHLDIKPHNILLDENFSPKIADFGLAKLYSRKESIVSMLEARGTIGYIAPEVFNKNFGGVSHKSDVYSYGMLILEMVGGKKNVDIVIDFGHTSEMYFPYWIYNRLKKEEILLDGVTTIEENDYVKKMTIVALWCIQANPTQRPSINEAIEMLEGSTEELEVPPKPFYYSPPRLPISTFSTTQEASQDHCSSTKS